MITGEMISVMQAYESTHGRTEHPAELKNC